MLAIPALRELMDNTVTPEQVTSTMQVALQKANSLSLLRVFLKTPVYPLCPGPPLPTPPSNPVSGAFTAYHSRP